MKRDEMSKVTMCMNQPLYWRKLSESELLTIAKAFDGGWHNCEFAGGSTFYSKEFKRAIWELSRRACKFGMVNPSWGEANAIAEKLRRIGVTSCRGGLINAERIQYICK